MAAGCGPVVQGAASGFVVSGVVVLSNGSLTSRVGLGRLGEYFRVAEVESLVPVGPGSGTLLGPEGTGVWLSSGPSGRGGVVSRSGRFLVEPRLVCAGRRRRSGSVPPVF